MRILVTGASGFIGGRLFDALLARGHDVVGVSHRTRRAPGRWIVLDLNRATRAADWRPVLAGIEVVVNAVGIFREHGSQRFESLHSAAPRALFDACVETDVRRVVQISALGVEHAATAFQRTKLEADRHLLASPIDGVVVRPSLVFGLGGTSASAFLRLAAAPVLLLPAGGNQPVQPVHIDDVVAALCGLVESAELRERCVALVGPAPYTLATYLQALRRALGLQPAPAIAIPAFLVAAGARLGEWRGTGLLDRSSWRMLQQGDVASADAITRLIGHAPRAAERFIDDDVRLSVRDRARLGWLLPLLRVALACVWIGTALVSVLFFPHAQSYELLARTGVPAALQPTMLFGAAGLDLVLGVLTLAPPRKRSRRRVLWLAQAALMALYMVIIAWKLPEFWLHPYGPLLKNVPMLAILVVLYVLDD